MAEMRRCLRRCVREPSADAILRADRSPAPCDPRDPRPHRRGSCLCAGDIRPDHRLAGDDVGDPDLDDAGGDVGTSTSTFDGAWTLDPDANGDCEETCVTYRPTGTVKWTWDARYPKQGSSRPACNSTTSGSVEAATAVTFEASELTSLFCPAAS